MARALLATLILSLTTAAAAQEFCPAAGTCSPLGACVYFAAPPDIPPCRPDFTPRPASGGLASAACGMPFAVAAQALREHCGGRQSPADRQKLADAQALLIATGFFAPQEFDGVAIGWCAMRVANGIVPEPEVIWINTNHRRASAAAVAALVAHEMVHVRQYRLRGAEAFRCDYVRTVGACLLGDIRRGSDCQEARYHPIERDGYAMAEAVAMVLGLRRSPRQRVTPDRRAGVTRYEPPLVHGRRLQACDGACAEAPASAFCRLAGHGEAADWTVVMEDAGRLRPMRWQPAGFVPGEGGAPLYASITCWD